MRSIYKYLRFTSHLNFFEQSHTLNVPTRSGVAKFSDATWVKMSI